MPRIVVVGSSNTDMVISMPRIPVPGETIRFATRCAAVSVTRRGAQPSLPAREEVED